MYPHIWYFLPKSENHHWSVHTKLDINHCRKRCKNLIWVHFSFKMKSFYVKRSGCARGYMHSILKAHSKYFTSLWAGDDFFSNYGNVGNCSLLQITKSENKSIELSTPLIIIVIIASIAIAIYTSGYNRWIDFFKKNGSIRKMLSSFTNYRNSNVNKACMQMKIVIPLNY